MKHRIFTGFFLLIIVAAARAEALPQGGVYVSAFANMSGDIENDWLGYLIADSIAKNLQVFPQLEVAVRNGGETGRATFASALEVSSLCEAGRSAGAAAVIGGDFRVEGDSFLVNASFYEVDGGKLLSAHSFTSSIGDLYSHLNELSLSLAGGAGVAHTEEQYKRVQLIPTVFEEAIILYGKALMVEATSPEHAELLLRALAVDHSYTDALSALGVHYYKTGALAKSQEAFDRLVQTQPDYPNAYYNLGLVLNSRMHYTKAINAYQLAIEKEPKDADVWNNLGVVYYEMGMYSDAAKSFERALQLSPDHSNAQMNLSRLKQKMEKGLTERPHQTSATFKKHIEAGAALYLSGDYYKAIKHFQKALELEPSNFKANNNMAMAYMKLGDTGSAKEYFKRALKADPTADDVRKIIAELEAASPPAATEVAAEAASAPRDTAAFLRAAGKANLLRKDYDRAEDAFLGVLEQNQNNPDALHGLGLVYMAKGDYIQARQQFEEVLSLDPQNEEAQKRLEDVKFILAAEASQPSLQIPLSPEIQGRAHFVRANELYQKEDYAGAIAEYLRALDLAPADVRILNNLGTAYYAAGRFDEAKAALEKAKKIQPNNETIDKNLQSIALIDAPDHKGEANLFQIVSVEEKMPESPTPTPASQPDATPAASEPASVSTNLPASPEPEPAARLSQAIEEERIPTVRETETTKEVAVVSAAELAGSAQDHLNRGIFKEGTGDLEAALAHYREAVRLEPGNAVAQYNLGNVYFRLGAFESAIQCYNAALLVDPKLAKGYNNIGAALYRLDRIEEAKEAWRRALELEPTIESARENLNKYSGS
ncbi:MAG: tetratricopeptide repeat protein [Candidatus Abyssobacteria bacterium SURF_5]|uniref:Tetratricopeptide repeat protein n=1 Tax=Abyssobacteria bacterium (strain SURF_5) TaxID=2093360 RepID=A0A3A4NMA3_ABYX5|nr:MAG: tetratricopeptide repeat protein [Candidatus Abyssubacteria bacterium SURF_5]